MINQIDISIDEKDFGKPLLEKSYVGSFMYSSQLFLHMVASEVVNAFDRGLSPNNIAGFREFYQM